MPASPDQYHSALATDADGQAVLDDLLERFGRAPFAAGQPDVTAFNCGAKAVIEHILLQISKSTRI